MITNLSTQGVNSYYGDYDGLSRNANKSNPELTDLLFPTTGIFTRSAHDIVDTFQTSSSQDKDILAKLKGDVDNCKRENFDSDEEYNTELNRRIKIYMDTKERIDQNNNNNSSERMELVERFFKSAGQFIIDIGIAVEHGGEAVLNFFVNMCGGVRA